MAGTIKGGKKAAETVKKIHGKNFYKGIGHIGGKNGHTGGFAANPELAKIAGAKGGSKSKRGSGVEGEKLRQRIVRLHNKGYMNTEIAKRIGKNTSTVYYHLKVALAKEEEYEVL